MSDRIQIDVIINGHAATLADVSLETLTGMRDKAKPKPKPIEHGDYGYVSKDCKEYRLFVEINGVINAYDRYGCLCCLDVYGSNRRYPYRPYIAMGNVFKGMEKVYDNS